MLTAVSWRHQEMKTDRTLSRNTADSKNLPVYISPYYDDAIRRYVDSVILQPCVIQTKNLECFCYIISHKLMDTNVYTCICQWLYLFIIRVVSGHVIIVLQTYLAVAQTWSSPTHRPCSIPRCSVCSPSCPHRTASTKR